MLTWYDKATSDGRGQALAQSRPAVDGGNTETLQAKSETIASTLRGRVVGADRMKVRVTPGCAAGQQSRDGRVVDVVVP